MADVHFETLPETANNKEIIEYINKMSSDLNYILENIDEENLTDSARNKLNGGK